MTDELEPIDEDDIFRIVRTAMTLCSVFVEQAPDGMATETAPISELVQRCVRSGIVAAVLHGVAANGVKSRDGSIMATGDMVGRILELLTIIEVYENDSEKIEESMAELVDSRYKYHLVDDNIWDGFAVALIRNWSVLINDYRNPNAENTMEETVRMTPSLVFGDGLPTILMNKDEDPLSVGWMPMVQAGVITLHLLRMLYIPTEINDDPNSTEFNQYSTLVSMAETATMIDAYARSVFTMSTAAVAESDTGKELDDVYRDLLALMR